VPHFFTPKSVIFLLIAFPPPDQLLSCFAFYVPPTPLDQMIKSTASPKRQFWGRPQPPLPQLNLTQVQKESWNWFLEQGIPEAISEINPIEDFTGKNWQLEFGNHSFDTPPHTSLEAMDKGLSFTAPLKVDITITNLRTQQSKTQSVFLGDIPLMTDRGTFVINGIERAIVNQIIRSPGVYFSAKQDPASNRLLHTAELRPVRGSWLEFETNKDDTLAVRIDRRRKFPITTFLRAIGFSSDEDILSHLPQVDGKPSPLILKTFKKDSTSSREQALIEIYKKLHPGEPAVLENAENMIHNMFFNPRRYDLTKAGRYKINKRLGLTTPNQKDNWVLQTPDVLATLTYLIHLNQGQGNVDDIDHLSNRRIRRVGELVASTSFRTGLLRLERAIKEKMSLSDPEEVATPVNLVNARPVVAAINEFFRSNQLSTILEQTNPLSEIDNLRRVSVMGPGGISRERASFSIRDVHSSQYGRICPVNSPEGPNIGLVTYLTLYTRVNEYGFLETPYRKVVKTTGKKLKMKVTNNIVYLPADDEESHFITHADLDIDSHGYIKDSWVAYRHQGKFLEGPVEQINLIDIVPRQVVGSSASLIPFLAHDEANRALMGSRMQGQAVPLVKPSAPVVGTGMEASIAESMNWVIHARHAGTVTHVDADRIVVKLDKKPSSPPTPVEHISFDGKFETYHLTKFKRSAQSTCYNQHPMVNIDDRVKPGQTIIDGPACKNGELSLGQNLLIAYMSYAGLGFEDAITISDRLVKQDLLTSIHIEEYTASVVETKLGPEELTRDIPNVSEEELKNLTDNGIVAIGSEVGPDDILVGKIAPKGETELSAEERLLRAIFGEKAKEVRDTSLHMPHGESGTVIGVQVLDQDQGDELEPGTLKKVTIRVAQIRKISVGDKLAGRHGNKGIISKVVPAADMPHLKDGTPIDIIISPLSVLARMNLGQLLEAQLGLALRQLNQTAALPVFERVSPQEIDDFIKQAHLPVSGKAKLIDGRTGDPYEQETMIGIAYILKLTHMAEDKTHARSTGPYSLVTQQPLGGKAQMGGQRLGEMEVWALEAHRAAHTLQEMLTIKSDDVVGRAKAFEAIIKGTTIPESTIPESFKVLVKELQSLGIEVIPQGVTKQLQSLEDIDLSEEAEESNESSASPSDAPANDTSTPSSNTPTDDSSDQPPTNQDPNAEHAKQDKTPPDNP
jgi:DNA-directed RNA polymerase subunit beta